MNRLAIPLIIALGTLPFLLFSCGDTNTTESCQYQTTQNLDKGNYDAVLQSSCATPMDLAAAYFGKAGHSVTSVINSLITAQATQIDRDKALQTYLNVLTRKVSPDTITFLDDAQARYLSVPPTSDLHKSAQFDLSIVMAIKAVSLLKTAIDGAGIGMLSACDVNANGVPDEADATACALLASGSANPTTGTCTGTKVTAPWTATGDLFFTGPTGTYRGLTVNIGSPSGSCAGTYQKLLYQSPADGNYYVATTSGTCSTMPSGSWACPVTSNIDLVDTVKSSIDGTMTALTTAIPGSASTDVQQALEDIKTQACGGLTSTCTAATIADYIQNHL